jgi:ketosteroid isomerase-like protein
MIDYATGGDLLERLRRVVERFDGDALVSLFTPEAELFADAFGQALTGHNAIRAYWMRAADERRDPELTIERHWVSGRTVLASWHMDYVRPADGARVEEHGFSTLELRDGLIERLRQWVERRETAARG